MTVTAWGRAVLAPLERAHAPDPPKAESLRRHALKLALAGFAERGRSLAESWQSRGTRSAVLEVARATFLLVLDPGAAVVAAERLPSRDDARAVAIAGTFLCGDFRGVITLAERHPSASRADTCAGFVVQAHVELGELAEAAALVEAIERGASTPDAVVVAARARAFVLMHSDDPFRATKVLEKALASSPVSEPVLREMLLTDLALARAQAGLPVGGDVRPLGPAGAPASPLAAFGSLARASAATFVGDYDAAWREAALVQGFAIRSGNQPLFLRASFLALLSASEEHVADAFGRYRDAVKSLESRGHARMLSQVAPLCGGGTRPLRDLRATQRCRGGPRGDAAIHRLPLIRIWMPSQDLLSAPLFFSAFEGTIRFSGSPPYALGHNRISARLLEELLGAPGFSLPVESLFAQAWGRAYRQREDANILHVAVHRLRTWLQEQGDFSGPIIVIHEGIVELARGVCACVLDLPTSGAKGDFDRRVVDLVDALGPCASTSIARHLKLPRALMQTTLRRLVAEGHLMRQGRARSTRYAVARSANAPNA